MLTASSPASADQPPPDLPPADDGPSNKKKSGPKRPWFSRDASSYSTGGGYQSGASSSQGPLSRLLVPSCHARTALTPLASPSATRIAHTNYSSPSAPVLPTHAGPSTGQGEGGAANSWETRFGWRVDFEAAGAYVLGPISGASPFLPSPRLHWTYSDTRRSLGLARQTALILLILESTLSTAS